MLRIEVNGESVEVPDDGASLLEVLRDRLALRAAKDGCSPQGQCGCCTVLVDGEPRVACVTAARRVAGRSVTTLEGLDADVASAWAEAFCGTGASQCGFCTPGIVVRLEALRRRGTLGDRGARDRALAAHLCRCTGWNTIHDAAERVVAPSAKPAAARDLEAAGRRASLEGHSPQHVAPSVAMGRGGFGDDDVPADALVAVPDATGEWQVAGTLTEARRLAGKVQGRRTTVDAAPPLDPPPGDWTLTLSTTWVEPAYLEVDAAWSAPGGEASSVLANGGAFGGKVASPVPAVARELADRHGRPVVARWSREDAVRWGPKRPPVAIGMRPDGTGVVRVARTVGIGEQVARVAPDVEVVEVEVAGPPTSVAIRGAGWVEVAVVQAAVAGTTRVAAPGGGAATASVTDSGLHVVVEAGDALDDVVLHSYCVGAAHMALGWVTSEGLVVDPDTGEPLGLTIRSFGIIRAADMPAVTVQIVPSDAPPVAVSDAVVAAVATAVWQHQGCPPHWPTRIPFAP